MSDDFENHSKGLESPFDDGQSVTPNDAASLTKSSRALYIGTGGDVAVRTTKGTNLLFANVPNGTFIPGRFDLVYDTGTDADNIVALW